MLFKYSSRLPTFHSQGFDYARGVFHLRQKGRNRQPPPSPQPPVDTSHIQTPPCAPSGSRGRPAAQTLTNIPTGAEQWESYRVWNSIATVSPLLHLSARPRNLRGPSRNLSHCSPLSNPIVGIHSARAQWVSGQTRLCCN